MDNSLQKIIHSLNEDEYKKISQRLKQSGKNNAYVKIFEFYHRNKTYKAADLEKVLLGIASKSSIAVLKNQLKEMILDQLRLINPNTTYHKFYALLDHIEWLSSRNLYKEARFYIQKLHKEATVQDFSFFYGAAVTWDFNVIQFLDKKPLDALQKSMDEIKEKYLNEIKGFKILNFYFAVQLLYRQKQIVNDYDIKATYLKFMEHEVFKMDASAPNLSLDECFQIAKSKSFIYMALGDSESSYEQAMIYYKKLKPELNIRKKSSLESVFWGLQYILVAVARSNHQNIHKEIIDLNFSLLNNATKANSEIYLRLLSSRVSYIDKYEPKTNIDAELKRIEVELEKIPPGKLTFTRIDTEFFLALIYFRKGNYAKAFKYNDRLLTHDVGSNIRTELLEMARVVNLIILFTQYSEAGPIKDYPGLISQAKSLLNHFRKKATKGNYMFEIEILRFISKFNESASKKDNIRKLNKLASTSEQLYSSDPALFAFPKRIYQVAFWTRKCITNFLS